MNQLKSQKLAIIGKANLKLIKEKILNNGRDFKGEYNKANFRRIVKCQLRLDFPIIANF